jgi:hypothetical protein
MRTATRFEIFMHPPSHYQQVPLTLPFTLTPLYPALRVEDERRADLVRGLAGGGWNVSDAYTYDFQAGIERLRM